MEKTIKGKLGFGCMRLPLIGEEVDHAAFSAMVDEYMRAGFNYFDTARVYLGGRSETAIKACLTSRYPREDYILTDKLTFWCIDGKESIRPFFESQLESLGVDYLDYYLFHALNRDRYASLKEIDAFSTVRALRDEGKIKHIGLSFHDSADILDKILTEQADIEVVQLQINYLDYDDPGVQSKACYDVAVKHGKKVIVMEPVKGGVLAKLPPKSGKLLASLGDGSQASFALRYAASFPEVMTVLSGMGDMNMMRDNIATFTALRSFSDSDNEVIARVRASIREENLIPCTGCNYCGEECPKEIPIPKAFAALNKVTLAEITRSEAKAMIPTDKGALSDCIGCGACEGVCPQGIKVRELVETAAKKLR